MDRILRRIEAEGQAEVEALEQAAREGAEAIKAQYRLQGEELEGKLRAQAQAKAAALEERMTQEAAQERQLQLLAVKWDVVEEAYAKAAALLDGKVEQADIRLRLDRERYAGAVAEALFGKETP